MSRQALLFTEFSECCVPGDGVTDCSPAMAPACEQARLAAGCNLSVFITGEPGTGKSWLAQWIHDHSARRGNAFVRENAAGWNRETALSELFGHARGAFTGAHAERLGLWMAADRGTLLLDEIGDVPADVQTILLGVCDDGVVRALGSNVRHRPDVRLICTTNCDLPAAIAARRFRRDLAARLGGIRIHLRPLRERREGLRCLAVGVMACAARRLNLSPLTWAPDALDAVQAYDWPENVRQLTKVAELLLVRLAPGLKIARADLAWAIACSEDGVGNRVDGDRSLAGAGPRPAEADAARPLARMARSPSGDDLLDDMIRLLATLRAENRSFARTAARLEIEPEEFWRAFERRYRALRGK